MKRIPLLLASALLTACTQEPTVRGSPLPLNEFGAYVKEKKACPSMQGVFEWPPAAGAYAHGAGAPFRIPWSGDVPVNVPAPEAQIWVREGADGLIEIRSRPAFRRSRHHEGRAPYWRVARFPKAKYTCAKGLLTFQEIDVPATADDGTSKVRRGFVLARLEDGSLAVGVKNVRWGQKSSIFSWADVSAGSMPAPDTVTWYWSKLTQMAPGNAEPPVLPPSRRFPPTHLGWQ